MSSTRHGQVYHAAHRRQAASLSLAASRLRGLKQACQVEAEKTAGLFAAQETLRLAEERSGSVRRVLLSCLLKGDSLILLPFRPDGKENTNPDIGQGANGNAMALAFSSFALVIGFSPWFKVCALPGKLLQSVAQGLNAAQASMSFLIRPTLEKDRRGASERLQASGPCIARPVIADFSQQTRSETFSSAWQRLEELVVSMPQKKTGDLLLVGGDLLHEGQELSHQCQHQARFGSGRDLIGKQLRLRQPLSNLLGDVLGLRMPRLLEGGRDLLSRSGHGQLRRRIGWQQLQGRALLELAKQLQSHWVVRLEAGGELIDQPGLHLDQSILVAGEDFEFLDQFALGVEPTPIGEIGPSGFRQQLGINRVRFGSRRGTPPFNGAWVNRIDRPALLQQIGNQQTVFGLHDTGHLFSRAWSCHLLQIAIQLVQSFWRVSHTDRTNLTPLFINGQRVVMISGPIKAAKPHRCSPLLGAGEFLNSCVLILWRSKRDSLMTSRVQERRQERTSFLNRSSRVEKRAFPRRVQQFPTASVSLAPALCREGLLLV